MKNPPFFAACGLMAMLIACTIPTTQDFQSSTRPLSSDEFVAIWRFPRAASPYEIMDTSQQHALEMERYMDPLFQQLIPRIFADARTDKLTIYQEMNESQLNKDPITDLPAAMADSYGADWQHLEPFMSVFHIFQRRKLEQKGFLAEELDLELITVDPQQEMPERRFGSVRMADLIELEYQIEFEGKVYALRDYLVNCLPFMYPIHYRTQEFANGLISLKQAFGTKKIVLDGRWPSLKWLGYSPNLTAYTFEPQDEPLLTGLTGIYTFTADSPGFQGQEAGEKTTEIRREGDHLVMEFPHLPPYYRIELFPNTATFFFNGNDDEVNFEETATEIRFVLNKGKESEVTGIRKK